MKTIAQHPVSPEIWCIAQHFIMSKMADHITSGSCYYTTSGNDKTVTMGFHHSLVIGPGFPNYYEQ